MLNLKRITHFNDFIRCQVSQEIMTQGDYYYEDDEDGFIVNAVVYKEMKLQEKRDKFDYSKLANASSQREYSEMLKQYEREMKTHTLLDRKVAGEGVY